MLFVSNASRVRLLDLSFSNSPEWSLHFSSVADLHVARVRITNPPTGAPNSDGIDLDCVQGALVEDSEFAVGDDALCVKSGLDWAGRMYARPSRDIVFRNLTIGSGHGISIGSETSGSASNITFERLHLKGTDIGPRIKSQRGRGGVVDGVAFRDIVAEGVRLAFSLSLDYHAGVPRTNATATPRLRNVLLQNVTFRGAGSAGEIEGLEESPIANVTLRDVHFEGSRPTFGACRHATGSCEGSTNACPPCLADRSHSRSAQ